MKILVIGANGQLGVDLLKVASNYDGFEIVPLYRRDIDVEEVDRIENVLKGYDAHVIINCSSYHKTDEVEDNGSKAVTVNAHAVEALANAAKSLGARFFHVSTDYVFDGSGEFPYTEEDTPAPINVYGASKYLGEVLARRAHADTLILRVASLFGVAGASGKGGNFVETMIRLAKEKGKLGVVNDVRMSPTSTTTIAESIFELLRANASPGVYNVVNSGDASWYEFADEIISQVGLNVPVNPVPSSAYPTRAPRPTFSVLDNEKLTIATGKRPMHWKDALNAYLKEKNHL